jgi:hypothetical protein
VTLRPRLSLPVQALTLAALVAVPAVATAKSKAVKKLQSMAGQLAGVKEFIPPEDPRMEALNAAIAEVGQQDDAEAANTLLALLSMPCQSASVEVTLIEGATDALTSSSSKAAHDACRKRLSKSKKKNPELAATLAEIVGSWPEPESAEVLGELVESKNPMLVMSGARGLGKLGLKEGIKPLVDVFGTWLDAGGEPINVIGAALYEITGLALRTGEDWTKWWKDNGADWDPSQKGGGDSATSERPKNWQKPGDKTPNLFESVEISSKKIVIIMDTSGSMHIRQFVEEPKGEEGEGGGGTSLAGAGKLPKGVNPNADGYKPKPCTFSQCPGARGSGPECPSDENLPIYYSRMKRLPRNMVKVVRSLRSDVQFQLVAFSTEARTWKGKKLLRATASNKDKAVKWLEGLQAGGFTNAGKAIDLAFTIPMADTFIFVTDGGPTNPAGRPYPAERYRELLDLVKRKNKRRKVRIDVVAISEGHTDFSSGLADENGGEYTVVD